MSDNKQMDNETRAELLLSQWSHENLKPLQAYSRNSHIKGIWICPLGHRWETEIRLRYQGSNCPYCGNSKVLPGFNDLATLYPEVAADWDYKKNGDLRPEFLRPFTGRSVHWKCRTCGYEWTSKIFNRSKGAGCPACKSKKAGGPDYNLLAVYPDIAKEWDYNKNDKGPESYRPSSNETVWWICKQGHSWNTQINTRTRSRKANCPYCAGRMPIPGETDLATTHPDLIKEWDFEKNEITPQEVSFGSHRKVWWICPHGHSYQAQISNRVRGKGCNICAKKHIEYAPGPA